MFKQKEHVGALQGQQEVLSDTTMSVQKLSLVQELSVQDLANSCTGRKGKAVSQTCFVLNVQPVLQNLICFRFLNLLISKEKG